MGVGFSLDVLSTDAGWVPRAAYGKLTTNLFGFDIDMFEVLKLYSCIIIAIVLHYGFADWSPWYRD